MSWLAGVGWLESAGWSRLAGVAVTQVKIVGATLSPPIKPCREVVIMRPCECHSSVGVSFLLRGIFQTYFDRKTAGNCNHAKVQISATSRGEDISESVSTIKMLHHHLRCNTVNVTPIPQNA
jgi:hypothetical protein